MKLTEKIILGIIAVAALVMFLTCIFPESADDLQGSLSALLGFFRGVCGAVALTAVKIMTKS